MGYLWRINITLTLKLIHSSSIEYRAKLTDKLEKEQH